ncbi:MAG: FAD:protein FMN transferase [Bacteroidota bacterium]
MNKVVFRVVLFYALVSCGGNPTELVENRNTGGALGTSYGIVYLSAERQDLQRGIDSIFNAINRSLSTYIPNSDISRINKGDTSVVVDDMFREVFQLSQEVHGDTDGYFDPTVGVLVNAWGFGPGPGMVMDSIKVDSLLQYVGLKKITLTKTGHLQKENSGTYLDFNAIAKGYAIDRLAAFLDQQGINDYLVEVGGELVGKGENRIKKKPWTVGIDDPQITEGRQLKITMHLKDRALASSGNYRKFRIDSLTGKKYVHTIDPKSGFTKNSNTLGTTVLAPSCALADAYATAFMAMDLEKTRDILKKQDQLDAYIVYLDVEGNVQEFMTPGFKELVVNSTD